MLLGIDCGNTKTKWAVFNPTGEISEFGSCLNSQLSDAALPPAINYQRVIISNVANAALGACLIERLTETDMPIHSLQSPASMGGWRNHYEPAQSLGCDRFAAMMGAFHKVNSSCVVVNVGTAVTIDALSIKNKHADFLGGLILPGLHLMQNSLAQATAQLPDNAWQSSLHSVGIFAKNTLDAMQVGAVAAIIGAIQQMATALAAHDQHAPHILISGGDAALIKTHLTLTTPCSMVDNLVLHGLYCIDRIRQSE